MIFARPRASPLIDGRLGYPLLHMQLETQLWGVLVSSYCCSFYRAADPFSFLGTFSSSFVGDPVLSPVNGCEHPLLYLPGTGRASQETAILGSSQQAFVGIHIVSVFGDCIWDGSPGEAVLGWSFLQSLLHTLSHGYFVPTSKKGLSIHTLVFLLEFHVICELYLGYSKLLG